MPDPSLASVAHVQALAGRTLDPGEQAKADAVLSKASALFRAASGQRFTPGESTVRRKVNGGRVYLPQRPVVAVTQVVDDRGDAVPAALAGQWLSVFHDAHHRHRWGSSGFVTVTYTHGGQVPDLAVTTVAEVAASVLGLDPAAAQGATQRSDTAGPYTASRTYAEWAVGGRTRLSPEDLAVARSLRVVVPTAWVAPG